MAGSELNIIIGAKDKTGPGLGSVGGKIDALGAKMRQTGRSLTTGLTLPILGVGIASAKAMSEFQGGIAGVGTLLDATTEEMDDMGKSVLAISRRTPVAISEMTDALYDLVSGGVAASDAMNVLERTSQLSVVGFSSASEAAKIVTSTMNAFNIHGEEANGVYDALFTTVKHGKLTLKDLGSGFGSAAAKAADSGVKVDEYLASVSALTTVGNTASESQTQLKAAISGLLSPTKEFRKVLTANGVKTLDELIEKSGGLVATFDVMSKSVDGSKAKIKAMVGSTEGMAAITALTGTVNEAFIETLDDMRDGTDSLSLKFKEMGSTSSAQWQKTKNSMVSAAISMGTVLAPMLNKIAVKVQELASWFNGLSGETKETIAQVGGILLVAGPGILALGKLVTVVKGVAFAVGLLNKAMLTNPVIALVAGLLAIKELTGSSWATLFSDAIEFWREVFGDFFEWIEGKFSSIVDLTRDAMSAATGGMVASSNMIEFRGMISDAQSSLDAANQSVQDAKMNSAINAIADKAQERRKAEEAKTEQTAAKVASLMTASKVTLEVIGETKVRVRDIQGDNVDVRHGLLA